MKTDIDINKIIAELVEKEFKTRAEWQALREKLSEKTWWKILRKEGGKYVSCYRGDLEWPIPQDAGDSNVVEYNGDVRTCRSGLHITSDPSHWLGDGKGTTLHKVDVDWFDENLKIGVYEDSGQKIAVSKLRVYGEADHDVCQVAGIAYRPDFLTTLRGCDQKVIMSGRAECFSEDIMGSVSVQGGLLEKVCRCEVSVEGGCAIAYDDCVVDLLRGSLVARGNALVKACGSHTELALYNTTIAHVHSTWQQRIYATDGATVVIHDNPVDLACLILSKNARAVTPTGRAIKSVNAAKFKVLACKNGMRKIVAR